MKSALKRGGLRVDGVYRKTRAFIIEEYYERPLRFFSVAFAIVLGLGLIAYWQPIRAQLVDPEPIAPAAQYQYKRLSELDANAGKDYQYFSGNYEVLSAYKSLAVSTETTRGQAKVEAKPAHPELNKPVATKAIENSPVEAVKVEPGVDQTKAGLYSITTRDPNNNEVLRNETVAWGVLAFNPDYSVYPVGAKAKLAMAVLDDRGKMICNARMNLEITDPAGQKTTLSTDDGSILVNEACFVYGETNEPDYVASYQTNLPGQYKVTLVAQMGDGTRTLRDQFSVAADQDYYLQRLGATRIFPPVDYSYSFNFQPKVSGQFELTEKVPATFEISDTKATIKTVGEQKFLAWKIDAKAGRDQLLSFKYRAPNISPYLFEAGPAEILQTDQATWQEGRIWLIASDASCNSNATGGGNWSASGSWTSCGGGVPGSADAATILNGDTITQDSASVTLITLTINNGGTLVVSSTNGISISNNYTNNGTFTANSSTITFIATSGGKTLNGTMTGSTGKFYNLTFNGSGGGWSLAAAAEVGNDLNVTNGSFSTSGSNYALTVTRDVTLANTSGVNLVANGSTITVSRNWTDDGGKFTKGTSTVVMDGTAVLGTALGTAVAFNNLSLAYSGKTITFNAASKNWPVDNVLTFNGGTVTGNTSSFQSRCSVTCSARVVFAATTTFNGSGDNRIVYIATAGSITVTLAGGDYGAWAVQAITISNFSNTTYNLGGDVTSTGYFHVDGHSSATGTAFNTQNYSMTLSSYFEVGTSSRAGPVAINFGSSTLAFNGTSDALRVASNGGTHTLNMNTASVSVKGNVLFVSGTGTITVTQGTSTLTWTHTSGTKTYTPNSQSLYNITLNCSGGTVQPAAAVIATGNFTITAGTYNVTASNYGLTIGGNYSNSGTFTSQSGTVTFNATDAGNTMAGTMTGSTGQFYNLTFNGSGGDWTPSSAVAVTNDLAMTAGSLLGTQNVTVNGSATGAGTITLTGGTFKQRVAAAKNFGTTSGSNTWTFSGLTFSNSHASTGFTITTQTGGSGGITVSGVLAVGESGDAAVTTLDAGNRTWTLSGTGGDPLQMLASPVAVFAGNTSTVSYTGNNGSGNTTVEKNAAYYNLDANNSSETFVQEGNATVSNDFSVTNGTYSTSGSNYSLAVTRDFTLANTSGVTFTANNSAITVTRNWTVGASAVFTGGGSTVTLNGAAQQTVSGASGSNSFYNLTITNASGASASDCELTGFTASVVFSNSAGATNNLVFTTANSRIQFNSGSTYTFVNINWNGQAVGTKIYFRNSAASGSWNLNVSGTQTAVTYVNVSRSNASSGSTIKAADGTNVDCGNNTNWSFANPGSPSSLAQKRTTDVTLSVGDWTNETSVKFTATVTDGDVNDVQICVEKDILGVSFSNTEDSCGSLVASDATATVTIGSLADTFEYHWQARAKDSAGYYSSWVSFGGNAESARDFGVDTSACVMEDSVYDGDDAGVDQDFNDGSVTSLAGNWDHFNCDVSGLSFYEYSVGTTIGGTDIKAWTNNSTNNGVNPISSLVLHTNQIYYLNVRATDTAGNLSSVANSNGQSVLPSISFTLGSTTITFSNLNDNNDRTDSKTLSLTTSTNAYGGYVVRQYATGLLTGGATTIPMFQGGSYASPAAWPSGFCTSGSNCGYGYTSNDTTIQGSNKFSTGTLFAPFATTAFGDIVADHTTAVDGSSGAISNQSFTLTHKVSVDGLQTAKSYQTEVLYIVTGTF